MDPPPDRLLWGSMFGDCLHNLRSALDHLAWQLAKRERPPPGNTEFPVFKDRAKYELAKPDGTPLPGSGLYKIRGIEDPLVRGAIAYFQPFKDEAEASPLWALHTLNNADKHRTIKPVMFGIVESSLPFKVLDRPFPMSELKISFNGAPLEDETEVFRISAPEDIEVGDDFSLTVQVMIELSQQFPRFEMFALVGLLVDHVTVIIDEFDHSFFGGSRPPDPAPEFIDTLLARHVSTVGAANPRGPAS